MIVRSRLRCYEVTGDKSYITKPYYETKDSEPDYSVPNEVLRIVQELEWRIANEGV